MRQLQTIVTTVLAIVVLVVAGRPAVAADDNPQRLIDLRPGTGGSFPDELVLFDNAIYFQADALNGMPELWRLNPADDSVTRVFATAMGIDTPRELTILDGNLYFLHDDENGDRVLRRYDPAQPDVAPLVPTGGSSDLSELVAGNGMLLFRGRDAQGDYELWRYDPATRAPAIRVADIWVGGSSQPAEITWLNGQAYFAASTAAGRELYRYNPTENSVTRVRLEMPQPGPLPLSPSYLTVLDSVLYFSATETASGRELWQYVPGNPTATLVANLAAGVLNSSPQDLTPLAGQLYFAAATDGTGRELFRYDPTGRSSPQLVADLATGTAGSFPTQLTPHAGRLLFQANSPETPATFWIHTPGGDTTPVAGDGSSGANFAGYGNTVYFAATDASAGTELWRYTAAVPTAVSMNALGVAPGIIIWLGVLVSAGVLAFATGVALRRH